jgi:hypothetical protein
MAVNLSPYGGVGAQFLDNAGNVLTGGKIETYAAGTTTPQATYTSSVGVTFHPNPIILDASGRVPSGGEIWLTDGLQYKFVLRDSNNVLIATYDNITGINSNFVNFVNQQEIQTATAGQTVFTLATTQYQPGTNSLSVFVDGVNQYGPGALYAYLETNSTTVTFVNGLHVGAEVKFTTSQLNSSGATAASQVSFTGFKSQAGTVQDLADDDGSDWIGFEQAGTGAVARSAQDKMRETLIARNDYDTTINFDAAKTASPTIPSLDGSGNFDAKVTPAGEGTQIALSDALMSSSGMQRGRINYFSGTQIEVILPDDIIMGGFRFMGNYKKKRAPMYSSGVSFRAVVSTVNDLGAESTAKADNWYAVFACANDGDTDVTYKLMPFIRVGSVSGSVCTLNYGGENSHTITPISYSWGVNSLADVECLVINEGSDNRFSGRVTTITANTTTTVTLDTVGSVDAYDYLLPAPPNFDHYCYLGTFYNDVASAPTNIADSGSLVMAYMSSNQDPNWVAAGAVAGPPGNKIMWGGYISPLASGLLMRSTTSTSTSAGGTININFSHDSSNHVIAIQDYYKEVAATSSTQIDFLNLTFSTSQQMYFWTAGSLVAQRILGQIRVQGWIEP